MSFRNFVANINYKRKIYEWLFLCLFVTLWPTLITNVRYMNILIIGATSGIGKALFEKYIIEGNRLGIVGRRAYLLDEFY